MRPYVMSCVNISVHLESLFCWSGVGGNLHLRASQAAFRLWLLPQFGHTLYQITQPEHACFSCGFPALGFCLVGSVPFCSSATFR